MSELKARHIVDVYDSYYAENPFGESSLVYLKSEADKVIALLKDKANYNEYAYKLKSEELAETCRFFEDELRHQKYKRCLALYRVCKDNAGWWDYEQRNRLDEQRGNDESLRFKEAHAKFCHYVKWEQRWLELAEKFKEAK